LYLALHPIHFSGDGYETRPEFCKLPPKLNRACLPIVAGAILAISLEIIMNDLEKYFRQNNQNLIHKWIHYFDVYDRYFNTFRDKEIVLLEIGVSQGGSLQMWKNYFGPKARIYGIDIDPRCKELEEENIKIFIGSQSDRKFLGEIRRSVPPVDILIDDGGHTMVQQRVTFEELFDHVKENGVYLCEDLHTSYWLTHGGGYRRRGSFIQYSKNFIDLLNAYHSEQRSLRVNKFTQSVDSIHYFDSMIVIEKRKKEKPYAERTGNRRFPEPAESKVLLLKVVKEIQRRSIAIINTILRTFRLGGFIWK
jgi:23S rRNA U2552 (ribose-2'-O)-methylase RlmE/FtsJ